MSASNRPPPDLNALLSDIERPSDVERSRWARAFRDHVAKGKRRTRGQDPEALLDFCLAANELRLKGESLRDGSGKKRAGVSGAAERAVNAERAGEKPSMLFLLPSALLFCLFAVSDVTNAIVTTIAVAFAAAVLIVPAAVFTGGGAAGAGAA